MSITVADLLVKVRADTSSATGGLSQIAGGFASLPALAIGAGLAVAGAVVGIGVASVKMAGDFQAGLTTLVTGAGESAANLGLISAGVLQMAVDTGTSTQQLVAGLFMIESAGYHGKAGLDVLKAAAEGAKVGNADLGVVADATTTIMKDFAGVLPTTAVNELVATVKRGKTHMQDLAESLSHVLPAASSAGVGLNDVMGAMATMTGEGVPAADAATYLRQMIISLNAPTPAATKLLHGLGLSAQDLNDSIKNKGLPATLQMLTDHIGTKFPAGSAGWMAAVKTLAGGSKQMQGFLDLTGLHAKDFAANVVGIGGAVKDAGGDIAGWAQVQGDFNFKMDRAKAAVEVFMIHLGTKLLPVLGQLVDWFTNHVVPALQFVLDHWGTVTKGASDFGAALAPVGKVLLEVGGWLLNVLGAAFTAIEPWVLLAWQAVQKFGGELSTRLGPAAKTVGDFLAATWAKIWTGLQFLNGIWQAVWPAMALVLSGIWNVIKGTVMVAWAIVSGIIKVGLDILGGNWKQAWTDIKDMFSGIWAGIKQILIGALEGMVGMVLEFVSGILKLLSNVPGPIGDMAKKALGAVQGIADQMRTWGANAGNDFAAGLLAARANVGSAATQLAYAAIPPSGGGVRHYQTGGLVSGPMGMPQLAIVHGGEYVIPAGGGALGGSGGSGGGGRIVYEVHNHIEINGREFARQIIPDLMDPLVDHIRRATGTRGQ